MAERRITVVGAGPAGSAAAIAALLDGASVSLCEKSATPRHKVCGEFISPEACGVLQELGVWSGFRALKPPRTERCRLHFGKRVKQWKFEEPAFGLSRLELDRLLLNRATTLGADVTRGASLPVRELPRGTGVIAAHGRMTTAARPGRLFAFKSHFEGPADDAVEVYFNRSGYIGLSPVENGMTNVCGIAPEEALRKYAFDFDGFVFGQPLLAERLRPLTRRMAWLATGPLAFSDVGGGTSGVGVYPAGDALGFVDPFTGSGILNALLTGRMAGAAAARGTPPDAHVRACRSLLGRPFAVAAAFRTLLDWGWGEHLAWFVPGGWMYRLTRASVFSL